MESIEARFWEKVEKTETCWNWTASKNRRYGAFKVGGRQGRNIAAHRFAYEMLVGEIPEDLVLDHLCRNKKCVNPDHLEPVTQRINVHRHFEMIGRTHCKNGHEWNDDNIYMVEGKYPQCRPCKYEAVKRCNEKKVGI
jgi:hypothetical protein